MPSRSLARLRGQLQNVAHVYMLRRMWRVLGLARVFAAACVRDRGRTGVVVGGQRRSGCDVRTLRLASPRSTRALGWCT
eukprot:5944015-Prymnesium_polylepis.2